MNISVRKCVPPPTVPPFNPPKLQLGKEDTATASLTTQPDLRSNGTDRLINVSLNSKRTLFSFMVKHPGYILHERSPV